MVHYGFSDDSVAIFKFFFFLIVYLDFKKAVAFDQGISYFGTAYLWKIVASLEVNPDQHEL